MPSERVLLVLYPRCIAYEAMLACELLRPHMELDVATADGGDHESSLGVRIAANTSYAAARGRDYRALLVPGGDVEEVLENGDLAELLRGKAASGSIIGAVCAGPLLVAKAGLLRGRRFTHGFKDLYQDFLAPFWSGATFVDELVVRDGPIVTAMAEGHVDFAIEMLAALGLHDDQERERKRRFYKGVRPGS